MAKKIEIDVIIDEHGDIKGDVISGPGGAGCLKELETLLSSVGRKTAEGKKPEFFQQVAATGYQTTRK